MPFSDLESTYGPANVEKLAAAYRAAVFVDGRIASDEVRMAVVSGLLAEARKGRFDQASLEGAAKASALGAEKAARRV